MGKIIFIIVELFKFLGVMYFLSKLNYWAILVSAIVYWLLGAGWFSLLGNIWGSELEKHGIKIKPPEKRVMAQKFVLTFILNLIIAFAVAVVVTGLGLKTVSSAIGIGLLLGICFSAATIGMAYLWESRSFKLTLIDVGYPILGILISAIILTLWK